MDKPMKPYDPDRLEGNCLFRPVHQEGVFIDERLIARCEVMLIVCYGPKEMGIING